MTSKKINSKLKLKTLLTLFLIGILCMSLFFVSACNNDTTSDTKEPTYTYTDTNDGLISNPNFYYGTRDTELTSLFSSSVTGWTRSKDTDASASSSKSGVIDVSENGWKALQSSLYSDSYYLNFLKKEYDFDTDKVKEAIKNSEEHKNDSDYKPTDSEIKDYIITEYFKNVKNPSVHTGATDNKVYMLNNYRDSNSNGFGASQKITSSSSITLNKGEYLKITVWVMTQNLSCLKNTSGDFGANIRINSTFNGSSQAQYIIKNIKADVWTPYTVYVKADADYSCTVTLALGLGNGLAEQTQGTAYFDDVTVTHLTETEYQTDKASKTLETKTLSYSSETALEQKVAADYDSTTDAYLYDMSLSSVSGFNTSLELATIVKAENGALTTSSAGTSADKFGAAVSTGSHTTDNGNLIISVNQASYTVALSSTSFILGSEEYAFVSFRLKNELNALGASTITVDVMDKNGSDQEKRAAVATITEINDEFVKYGVMIKNNFSEDDYPTEKRSFSLNVIVGPTNVATANSPYEFATGTVTIKDLEIAKGKTYQYDDDGNETPNYDLYSLYNATSNGSTELYAGRDSDYVPESKDSEKYSFKSGSAFNAIEKAPTPVATYRGVTSNHIYVQEEFDNVTLESDVNTRVNVKDGNVAGLVNTKHKDAYATNGYNFDLTSIIGKDNVQPIMIYNKTADHYGFIGDTNSISANSYAKVTVTLKVVGDNAKAYIYLVDVADKSKSVMEFVDFTANTDGVDYVNGGTEYKAADNKLSLEISASQTPDWTTVSFYVATGITAKSFRVEVWNGGRDGADATASTGYTFFKDITVTTNTTSFEPTSYNDAFTSSGNPLFDAGESAFKQLLSYKRVLNDLEKKFNGEATSDELVSYDASYVWAKNETIVYAVYNTLDVEENDPYANVSEEETESSGCTAETDPSTFWLSFSSILLGVALVVALLMLFIKNVRRRRKANASDAKSHYKITSRVKTHKQNEKLKSQDDSEAEYEDSDEDLSDEEVSVEEEIVEENEEVSEGSETEQTLDSYVYGEVHDFGSEGDSEKNDNE